MITGHTKLYGIIADPIHHVRGPAVFNALFAERGIDATLVPLHISSADLPALWGGLKALRNFHGILVTVPHKNQAAALCDVVDESAQRVGAVNVVRRLADGRMSGGMFDGVGFVAGLRANGYEPAGKNVLLLGAGGAASAIAFALADSGVKSLTIHNRTEAKAAELATQVRASVPGIPTASGGTATDGIDLVVNATSLGLSEDDPLPLPTEALRPGLTVAEIIMNPVETPLLREAKARGCGLQYGRQMLDHQVTAIFNFLGIAAS